jgi:hypothetical protein
LEQSNFRRISWNYPIGIEHNDHIGTDEIESQTPGLNNDEISSKRFHYLRTDEKDKFGRRILEIIDRSLSFLKGISSIESIVGVFFSPQESFQQVHRLRGVGEQQHLPK